jgi:hypothetical protein
VALGEYFKNTAEWLNDGGWMGDRSVGRWILYKFYWMDGWVGGWMERWMNR